MFSKIRRCKKASRSKKRIRKIVFILLSVLFFVSVSLWFGRHFVANIILEKALLKVADKAEKVGVVLVGVEYDSIEIPNPAVARLQHLETDFDIGVPNHDSVRSRFSAQNVELTAAGVFPPKVRIHLQGLSLDFHLDDVPENFPFDGFHKGSFRSAPLPLDNPDQVMKLIMARLSALFSENQVNADFNFSGYVSVWVKHGVSVDALLYTEEIEGGLSRLRFNRDDLQKVAVMSHVRISDAMLDILSEYPLRAPMLMVISHKAKSDADEKKKLDPSFPDDAYRHIQWSYHLTKAFGPEFARLVTDSHETLDGNTAEERLMDYHNNALARALLIEGVMVDQLEEIILTDPRVIRHPSEVNGFTGLLK